MLFAKFADMNHTNWKTNFENTQYHAYSLKLVNEFFKEKKNLVNEKI